MRLLRAFSLVVAALCGVIAILDYFVSEPTLDRLGGTLAGWVSILAALALVLGLANLARVHGRRIITTSADWPYSAALLAALLVTILLGIAPGASGANDPALAWVFRHVYEPLNATIFSLLAFYIATAAYRALRLQTWEAGALLIAGVIVLLGQVPLGSYIWEGFPQARTWLLAVVGTAGLRGILIAAALGAIFTGLRVIMGLDRQYLDKEK